MKISLVLFGLPPTQYAPLAVRAEAVGFEAVWLPDHLVTPVNFAQVYPYDESGNPGYDGSTPLADIWVTFGQIAALTTTLKLGSGVYILPLRNPFVSARAIAMTQLLSAGRVLLGIGTGWQREEFMAVGERFEQRGDRTEEIIDVMRKLWTGQPVEHHGRFYEFPQVQFAPALPNRPPLVIGGTSKAALSRAARLGDAWYGPNRPLEESVAARERIEREAAGRRIAYYVRLSGAQDLANVRRYESQGFEHVVVGLGSAPGFRPDWPLESRLDGLSRLAERLHIA